MIWTTGGLLGWSVRVTDSLLLDEAVAQVEIVDPVGRVARRWSVEIDLQAPGYPVWRTHPDGRRSCFGGPSHPVLDMARSRAGQLLAGLVEHARGQMQDVILAAREEARHGAKA